MTQKLISQSVRTAPSALAVVLIIVLGFLAFFAHAEEQSSFVPERTAAAIAAVADTVACTADAKLCPDGTSVGRVGPHCEFAPCPSVKRERLTPPRDQLRENVQERRDLYGAQQQAQREMWEQNRTELNELRAAEGTSEQRQTLLQEQQKERRALLEEHQDERAELHAESRAELKGVLEGRRMDIQTKMEERKAEMRGKIEERRAKLAANVQARLGQFIERIAVRMNAALDHLMQVAGRIGTRIATFEERGLVLDEAQAALDEAYGYIDVARADVAAVQEIATDVLASETPRERMGEIREAADLAKESIKAIHKALSDAVQEIKASAALYTEETGEEVNLSSDDGDEEESGDTEEEDADEEDESDAADEEDADDGGEEDETDTADEEGDDGENDEPTE